MLGAILTIKVSMTIILAHFHRGKLFKSFNSLLLIILNLFINNLFFHFLEERYQIKDKSKSGI